MVLLQSSQCVSACDSLGDTGGMIAAALIFAWGLWQKYQKGKAVVQSLNANARASQAETEKELYKNLSLRPAPVPLLSFPPEMLAKLQSTPPNEEDDYIPLSIPPDAESSPTLRAKPRAR
ncbi:MAG TPA: hypothetical protein VK524_34465 [Polyangiaceae bacterium]|nr:hypothetical protein [Polyangiaceae bacterium]